VSAGCPAFTSDNSGGCEFSSEGLLFGHAGVKNNLQQEIAELIAQIVEIAARDRISDFVGFLDRIRRNRREILFEIPWAAAARGA